MVTLVGVAYEKNIPLGSIEVDVKRKQNLLGIGPKDPLQRSLKITELRRTIHVTGPRSRQEADVLLWGADNCPVSNSLEGAIGIRTRLQVDGPWTGHVG
ncbi:MAG: hypothetical protein GEU78_02395 [Actinobacteria bacterium]|nr:hypothetical protein [Actinomycetota bacterium]